MKYLMKQKFFSLSEDFYIKTNNGQDAYFVDGQLFSIGFKCKLYDMHKRLQYEIKEKHLTFLSNYKMYDENGNQFAEVDQQFAFFKIKIKATSNYGDIEIEGDIFDWNYKIYLKNKLAAVVSKEFFTFTDTYSVDVLHEDDAFILALVCIIDNIIDRHKNNN
ncbi:MAG: LURP-one-related/scramblase family protein [Turicibacter sp.]